VVGRRVGSTLQFGMSDPVQGPKRTCNSLPDDALSDFNILVEFPSDGDWTQCHERMCSGVAATAGDGVKGSDSQEMARTMRKLQRGNETRSRCSSAKFHLVVRVVVVVVVGDSKKVGTRRGQWWSASCTTLAAPSARQAPHVTAHHDCTRLKIACDSTRRTISRSRNHP
jgi:hypothetical protein